MEKNSACPESIEAYKVDDESWESANFLFCLLATTVEERTSLQSRKSSVKKPKKKKASGTNIGNQEYSNDKSGLSPVRGGFSF